MDWSEVKWRVPVNVKWRYNDGEFIDVISLFEVVWHLGTISQFWGQNEGFIIFISFIIFIIFNFSLFQLSFCFILGPACSLKSRFACFYLIRIM